MAKRNCQGWQVVGIGLLTTAGLTLSFVPVGLPAGEVRNRGDGAPPPPASIDRTRPSPSAPSDESDDPTAATDPDEPVPASEYVTDPAELARLAKIRTALNPLLIRDRRHRLLLARGDEALLTGRTLEGIAHLQALLDAPQDAFYWSARSARPQPAQAGVGRLMSALAEPARKDYERLSGPAAQDLLLRYEESNDRRLLIELLRRFGHTQAAHQTAVRELLLARDAGRQELAAEWGRFLAADTSHRDLLTPALRTIVSDQQDRSRTSQLTQRGVEDRTLPVGDPVRDNDEAAFVGTAVSPPFPIPVWSAAFDAGIPTTTGAEDGEQSPELVVEAIQQSLETWLNERLEQRLPVASANEAVVAGETVIVRDFAHVSAYDLTTGQVQWRYICASSLATEVARRVRHPEHNRQPEPADFDTQISGNPVFGRLATDGQRVYFLDHVASAPSEERPPAVDGGVSGLSTATSHERSANHLVALPVHHGLQGQSATTSSSASYQAVWSRGEQSSLANDDLAGHMFLGPPLCVDERVFLLAETDLQISLIALEAATGRTLWKQGVALVKRPLADDPVRAHTACTPLYSAGIVLCPTEVGVIIGVDALTGHLQWVYDHLDEEQRSNSGRWTMSHGRKDDRSSLSSHSYVHDGRLLHLPRDARSVHCIDCETGNGIWTAERHDTYAIGGVTDTTVLLLGDRECRAVGLADGQPVCWRTDIPEPAGLGIIAGNCYLLPTADGRGLTVDLDQGHLVGHRFRRLLLELAASDGKLHRHPSELAPEASENEASKIEAADIRYALETFPSGNLIAHRGMVVATTPLGVSVFAQVRPTLERLQTVADSRGLSNSELLKQAQLLLTLGNQHAAGDTLETLLAATDAGELRTPAELLLREILYARLEQADEPYLVLDRIRLLARSDKQRLRYLLSSLDVALKFNDPRLLVAAVVEFPSLPDVGLLTLDESGYQVAAQHAFWERLSRLQEDDPADIQQALIGHLEAQAAALQTSENLEQLEQFATLFAGWRPVSAPRLKLARLWRAAGHDQQAELLLLSDRFRDQVQPSGPVERQLTDLYAQRGLMPKESHQQAGIAFGPVDERWQTRTDVDPPPTDELSAAFLKTSLVALDTQRGTFRLQRTAFAPAVEEPQVHITEHLNSGDDSDGESVLAGRIRELHVHLRRRFIPKQSSNLVVLDQGPVVDSDSAYSRLEIADRDRGQVRSEIDVPSAYWQRPHTLTTETGHVMVVGGETAFGLSLLEGSLLWSMQQSGPGNTREKIKVGPTGSDYCVLQTSRELRVVHPATGKVLWRRSQLPPGIGLLKDDPAGIIGDSRTLTVFDAGQSDYTVYHTQSGRELRRGSRQQAAGCQPRQCWAVGRCLVEMVGDSTGTRLTVWDSREDRFEIDVPVRDGLVTRLPNETEFAFVTTENRLQILNAAEGRLLVDLPLPETDDTSQTEAAPDDITAFSDRDRYYVNLVSKGPRNDGSTTSAATDLLDFPQERVRGRLLSIDKQDQENFWVQPVDDASLPLRPDTGLPMLVLIRQKSEEPPHRTRGSSQESLRLSLEVLDATNGRTLAQRHDLLPTRFLECPITHLPESAGRPQGVQLSLVGVNSQIDVTFGVVPHEPLIRTVSDDPETVNR